MIYSPAYYAPRWRTWFAGFDAASTLNGEPSIGSANLTHRTAGGAAGLDYQFNPGLLLGFAGSGTTSTFKVPDRTTSGQLDGGHLGVYAVGRGNSLYTAFAAAFGAFDTNTTRTISGIGPAETAKSHFESELFSSRFEVGSRLPLSPNFALTPFAAIQYSALYQPRHTETSTVMGTGAPGVLGLAYASQTVQSLPSFLGLRSDASFAFQNGAVWAPYVAVSWVHEFDPNRQVTPIFLALPGATFTVDGPRAARDAVKVDVGSKLIVTPNIALFGSFNGEFSDRSQMYAGKVGVRVAW
jgi:outer membrane autotransporter protein